jgi:two-component sensor histidine kinase
MSTRPPFRARDLLQRSKDLLERSRVAAVQFLDPPRNHTGSAPRVIELGREGDTYGQPDAAVVDICASIALRDLNLVDSLLALLERMEENEGDPDRLSELYKLDHLAARLRRNAENLRVLAGRDVDSSLADTTSLVDVIRGAMSSIDGYSRVSVGRVLSLGVVGLASDDLSRVLAELLDNAAKQSPPDSTVRVSAHLTEQGSVLMRIEDEGIGLPADRLAELNKRLSVEPKLDDASVRHMGLAVVRRLSARHELRVRLNRRSPHGTTATVLIPGNLVAELPEAAWTGGQTVVLPAVEPAKEPVPAARPAPRQRPTGPGSTTEGGLPRRRAASAATLDPAIGGTTANGLPRRVSRSIKNPDHGEEPERLAEPSPAAENGEENGHEQLLADLDAFADGQQAALDEVGTADPSSEKQNDTEKPVEGSTS